MRARPLDERLVWALGVAALLGLVVAGGWDAIEAAFAEAREEAARRAEQAERQAAYDAEVAKVVEPLAPDVLRMGDRRFALFSGMWGSGNDSSIDLRYAPGVARALGEDPVWGRVRTLWDGPFGVVVKAIVREEVDLALPWTHAALSWTPGVEARFEVPGHEGWSVDGMETWFRLVPEGLDPPYLVDCFWGEPAAATSPDGWLSCDVTVAFPDDPRVVVEWQLLALGGPDELRGTALAARSREALAMACCFDVTDGPPGPPGPCIERALGASGPAAPPVPPGAP